MKLVLVGKGRMGSEVSRLASDAGHEIVLVLDSGSNRDGVGLDAGALSAADAVVDFSRGDAALTHIRRSAESGVPIVVGTTGWYDELDDARKSVERHGTALVYGANFSIGANLFLKLAENGARLFGRFPDYDAYILEHHHRDKVDAPSGTAHRLAQIVLAETPTKTHVQPGNPPGKIAPDALHLSSLRAGAAFGRHAVGFDSVADSVEIAHTARSREGFARGALFAAEWIRGKRGVFEFSALMELE